MRPSHSPLLAYSSVYLTAGMTSILNATVPIFAALIGFLVYAELLDQCARGLGVVLGFLGVVVLVGVREGGVLPLLRSRPGWRRRCRTCSRPTWPSAA